jgi:hypothetical protein
LIHVVSANHFEARSLYRRDNRRTLSHEEFTKLHATG